jgi:UDP-GlcNAc:undecaprenyl-phosphate/decaprenyl-phosphate GlcNAc-1-phosphate transferase
MPFEPVSPLPSLEIFGILLMAITLSALGTWLVIKRVTGFGMDAPDGGRKTHVGIIPRLGGLPIFLVLLGGFALSNYKFPWFMEKWWPVLLCNSLIFIIGFIDDLRPLGARVKLLGQIGAACILYSFDVSIDILTNPFGDAQVMLGWWSFPITVLWLVAIPNIINLIDGMDGLASGFGLFICLTLAFIGHYYRFPDVVMICVVMTGALIGFLFFNLPPAKIFLGDGGAYLIGFFIASVSLESSNKGSVLAALLVMIVALGVPILDTIFAIIRRGLRGVPIFKADAEHIHHRLILLGFSKARALIAMYSVCLALSLIGISILMSKGRALPIAATALFLLTLLAARYLGYVKSWKHLRLQLRGVLERRRKMQYAIAYSRVLDWEAENAVSAPEFLGFLELAITRVGFRSSPLPGWEKINLALPDGRYFPLYYYASRTSKDRWIEISDVFVSSLSRASERWGDLAIPELPRAIQITEPEVGI